MDVASDVDKTLILSILDSRLNNKINAVLKKFPKYTFKEGEEAMYRVNYEQFTLIIPTLVGSHGSLASVQNFFENRPLNQIYVGLKD